MCMHISDAYIWRKSTGMMIISRPDARRAARSACLYVCLIFSGNSRAQMLQSKRLGLNLAAFSSHTHTHTNTHTQAKAQQSRRCTADTDTPICVCLRAHLPACTEATDEEVAQAAAVAHIHSAIVNSFKKGYDTRVGKPSAAGLSMPRCCREGRTWHVKGAPAPGICTRHLHQAPAPGTHTPWVLPP